jgi:hypothetical protein
MPSRPLLRAAVRVLFRAAAAGIAVAAVPLHAERIEPPLELLHAPVNMLVVGTLVEIGPNGRFVFRRERVLAGRYPVPERIDVLSPVPVRSAKVGRRYVFGYTQLKPDPRKPGAMVADENGAVLLTNAGLEPALFPDTAQVRALLEHEEGEDEEKEGESHELLERLLKALRGGERSLQDLAAAQIALDPELRERLDDGDRARIERTARDAKALPSARATLLKAAAAHPQAYGDWWQRAALEMVTTTPVGGYSDKTPDPSDLILVAMDVLDMRAVKVPLPALKRWMWSPNPALAERASVMLRRESPAVERSVVQQALADPKLPGQTRKFLDDHLRRLDRLDARLKARKDGTG